MSGNAPVVLPAKEGMGLTKSPLERIIALSSEEGHVVLGPFQFPEGTANYAEALKSHIDRLTAQETAVRERQAARRCEDCGWRRA